MRTHAVGGGGASLLDARTPLVSERVPKDGRATLPPKACVLLLVNKTPPSWSGSGCEMSRHRGALLWGAGPGAGGRTSVRQQPQAPLGKD